MKRVALASGGALVAGAIACGVITIPAEPIAPVNACDDAASCALTFPDASAAPFCVSGSCVGGSGFHPILVVAVPDDVHSLVLGAGGVTLALPDTYQATRGLLAPACSLPAFECDFVPPLGTLDPRSSGGGSLLVTANFGSAVWPPGLRPNQPPLPPTTSLPIHAVFRPMWRDPATNVPILATKLGLPLDDRDATVVQSFATSAGSLLGPTASPSAVAGFAFGAKIPQPIDPADPTGSYELVVTPDSPFDVVPPYVATYTLPIASAGTLGLGFDISSFVPVYDLPANTPGQPIFGQTYVVQEAVGAPSLAGWKLHIDRDDGTRISGLVTLGAGATKNVQVLWATGGLDQNHQTLYIDPPAGVDLPRYFSPAVGSIIVGPFEYPALPAPVIASGSVRRATDNAPATAHVFFVANGDPQAYVVEQDGATPASPLLYEKQAVTNDKGQFSVTLPPGVLRAYVVPDDPSLALTQASLTLDAFAGTQSGKTLVVNPRSHVTGRVLLPDGTPVYAADVVVGPSADAPFSSDDPHLRPRESSGTTDTEGRFDVLSDSGLVDVSVRPHDGTRLPWVVLVNRLVPPNIPSDAGAPAGLALGDVLVKLPTPFTQSLAPGILGDTAA